MAPGTADKPRDPRVTRLNALREEIAQREQAGDYAGAIACAEERCALAKELLGEHDAFYAAVLNEKAKLHLDAGDIREAERLLLASIEVSRAIPNAHPGDLGAKLNGLALILKTQGRWADAERYYGEAEELLAPFPDFQDQLATTLRNHAELHLQKDDTDAAVRVLDRATNVLRAAGNAHPEQLALLLLSFARVARGKAMLREATSFTRRALRIVRAGLGERHYRVALLQHELANLYLRRGCHGMAERLLLRASTLDKARTGTRHPDYASSLLSLADVSLKRHDHHTALTRAREALAILQAVFGERHSQVGAARNTVAEALRGLGRFDEADREYAAASGIAREAYGDSHSEVASTLNNWALLRSQMGDASGARELAEQGQAIEEQRGRSGHALSTNLVSIIASACEAMGDAEEALRLHRWVLDARRALLGADHPSVGEACNNLAVLCIREGDLGEAEVLLRESLRIARQREDGEGLMAAYAANNLGGLLMSTGRMQEAVESFRAGLDIRRRIVGPTHPLTATSLHNLSGALAATGDFDAALDAAREGAAAEEVSLNDVLAFASERQQLAFLKRMRESLHVVLSLVRQRKRDAGEVEAAYDLLLKRKGLTLDVIARRRQSILRARSPSLRRQRGEWEHLSGEIARLALTAASGSEVSAETLGQLKARRESIENEMARHLPGKPVPRETIDVSTLRNALTDGMALVEMVLTYDLAFHEATGRPGFNAEPRYLAFVLTKNSLDLVDLGGASHIDDLVARWRSAIVEGMPMESTDSEVDAGIALRKVVVDPPRKTIGTCTKVVFCPDGELTRIPFDALPLTRKKRLLDEWEISYLGTGRDLIPLGEPMRDVSRRALVIADPNFDLGNPDIADASAAAEEPPFEALPDTREEGRQVAQLLNVRARMGDQANRSIFISSRSPRILHIATHGFFLASSREPTPFEITTGDETLGALAGEEIESPLLRSGLALAGANASLMGVVDGAQVLGGLVTAEDVSRLDLTGTELVVLSACDTGLGDLLKGEGVFGLRRSFAVAGARSLVMALWKVPDDTTCDLMVEFHRELQNGRTRLEALTAARNMVRKRHPAPYNWGAFILQGEWRSLRATR